MFLGCVAIGFIGCAGSGAEDSNNKPPISSVLTLDRENRQIRFPATAHPSRFDVSRKINGHHLIVWKDGGAASKALFRAEVSDRDIAAALRGLGAESAGNLTLDTWSKRADPLHPAPQSATQGSPLSIAVQWDGSHGPIALDELVNRDPAGPIEIRFGGYEQYIDDYQSGCITCLFSCPGGKTSNNTATIRDQADGRVRFSANTSRLPADGAHDWPVSKG